MTIDGQTTAAGPSGAPLRVLEGAREERAVVELSAGWLYRGGARVSVPDAADPHWRGPDGSARTIAELTAGQSEAARELLYALHGEAVAELVRAAAQAKRSGCSGATAPAVAAASRLLHQLVAQGAA